MNRELEELVERIRGESSDLNRLVQRVLSVWNRSKSTSEEKDVYLESVALNLHGFYSGLERLFERIARRDELRRFRHLVRNVYTFNLVPDKIEPLITALPAQWPQVSAELLAFADFLSDLAQANKT